MYFLYVLCIFCICLLFVIIFSRNSAIFYVFFVFFRDISLFFAIFYVCFAFFVFFIKNVFFIKQMLISIVYRICSLFVYKMPLTPISPLGWVYGIKIGVGSMSEAPKEEEASWWLPGLQKLIVAAMRSKGSGSHG